MSGSVVQMRLAPIETLTLAARLNPLVGEPAVVVISGLAEDLGVAEMAIELARSFALIRGDAVLVADLGLLSARAAFAQVDGRAGVREVVTGGKTLADVEVSDDVPGLRLIGAGSAAVEHGLFLGPALDNLVAEMRRRYRVSFIVVDPLLAFPTAIRLARITDGVLLGVVAGHDRRDRLTATIRALDEAGATLLGCALVNP